LDYKGGEELWAHQWKLVHNPKNGWLKFLQDEEESLFAGGYALTPTYQLISVPNSKNLTTDGVSEEYLKTGALPGFVVIKDNVENFYIWNGTQYVNKSDAADIYPVEFVTNPATNHTLYLFYNLQNDCGSKNYIVTTYNNQIKSALANTDKNKLTTDITSVITALIPTQGKQLPCGNSLTTGNEWTEVDVKLNCAAADIQNAIQERLKKITSATKAQEVNAILKDLYSPCLFISIPIDKRIEILNILLQDGVDDAQWEFGYGTLSLGDNFFLDDLILSTPEKDRKKLLIDGFTGNNYKWIRNIFKASKGNSLKNNDATMTEIVPLFKGIASWVAQYYDELSVQPTQETISEIGVNNFTTFQYPKASVNPVYLGVQDDGSGLFDFEEIRDGVIYKSKIGHRASVDILDDGRVQFYYNLWKEYQGAYFTTGNSIQNFYEPYSLTLTAFEPVIMIASRNYLDLKIEKGKEYIVPAFFAAAIEEAIIDGSANESIRSLGNGVAIGAAVVTATFSGGTSYLAYLTYAGGIVSGADELLKPERQKLNQDINFKEKYHSYFDTWDIFYQSVLVADGLGNAYNLANNARKVNLVNAAKNFYSKMKTFDYKGELMNIWNELRGVSMAASKTSLLAKLEKFPNLKNLISRLDDIEDAALIQKIDNFAATNSSKLGKLEELYDNFTLPADRPMINGQKVSGNFTVTKTIDGKPVNVHYDRAGFPDFKPYSAGDDYIFTSNTLTGNPTDMKAANNAMKQKFAGQLDKFRWNSNTTWFEIRDVNGNWIQYTWHHYQDGRTMFPVPSNIHNPQKSGFNHSGGKSIIERNLHDIFN
jgi:hypothetical protein